MKRRIHVAALCGILCVLILCAAGAQAGQAGYPTPEAAAEAFVAAVAGGDFAAALDCTAVSRAAEGYDWAGTLERIMTYAPTSSNMPAPDVYDAYAPLNEAIAAGQTARTIFYFATSFLVDEGFTYEPVAKADAAFREAFVAAVDPQRLQNLSIELLEDPFLMMEPDKAEEMAALFQTQVATYGAQERVERVAYYELDGRYFMGGFGLIRYGDAWYVERLNSILYNQNAMGTVYPVPADRASAYIQEAKAP